MACKCGERRDRVVIVRHKQRVHERVVVSARGAVVGCEQLERRQEWRSVRALVECQRRTCADLELTRSVRRLVGELLSF